MNKNKGTKLEETNSIIECMAALVDSGLKIDNTVLLADIAKSLAIIADKLCEAESEEGTKDEVPVLYPENGMDCWVIDSDGNISFTIFNQCNKYITDAMSTDSVFFTKKEAEFELERRKTIAKLRLFAEKNAKWDGKTPHYYLSYSLDTSSIISVRLCSTLRGTIYFESQEQLQKAIDFAGEENVKKYYLGVMK